MARVGPIQLSQPICQAGLAGYSDRAMRLVARRRGCPYAVSEALLDVILCNGGQGLKNSIDINDEDHPIAGQIIGSEAETMARAARILADAGYDVIDLNFACPVKKIKNKARGGHMLAEVSRGIEIVQRVREAIGDEKPITVSLRRAFDESSESRDRFFQLIDGCWALGCEAVRVHGRTVEQKYNGRASWVFLRELKIAYPGKTIFGSGDVFTARDAVGLLNETGADVAWIARGAIGNPWIFAQIAQLLADPDAQLSPPTIFEQRGAGGAFWNRDDDSRRATSRAADAENGDQIQPISSGGERSEAGFHRHSQFTGLGSGVGSVVSRRRERGDAGG